MGDQAPNAADRRRSRVHPFELIDFDFKITSEFAERDGQPANPGITAYVHQVLGPQQQRQLTQVHLRNDHTIVAMQDVTEVGRERVQVPQVGVGDQPTGFPYPTRGGDDRPVGGTPAEHQDAGVPSVAVGWIVDEQVWNVLNDPVDLGLPAADHFLVVGRVIGNRAGVPGLFDAANTMLEPGRAWNRPGPGERRGVTQVRHEDRLTGLVGGVGRGGELRVDRRDVAEIGYQPGLCAVGDVAIGQDHHWSAVLDGYLYGLKSGREAVGGRLRRKYRNRCLAIAAEHHLQQISLLSLGRHAGARPGALDVADDQGQLGCYG